MLKPTNPCPVCGAETVLAEIEPHPLRVNFEIHGYLCERCGPSKSLVVLKTPGAEALKLDHNSYYDTTEKQKGHYPVPRDLSTLFTSP